MQTALGWVAVVVVLLLVVVVVVVVAVVAGACFMTPQRRTVAGQPENVTRRKRALEVRAYLPYLAVCCPGPAVQRLLAGLPLRTQLC